MIFRKEEALRYLGGRAGKSTEAGVLLDKAYLRLLRQVTPREVHAVVSCRVGDRDVELENGPTFHSRRLAEHLAGCDRVIIFAATLGSGVDRTTRALLVCSVAEGAAAQAVGAALMEGYCDELTEQYRQDFPGCVFLSRFSPGYGDWALTDQRKIFTLLECEKKIGLTLTEGMMMAPTKSVTAIIGIKKAEAVAEENSHDCSSCDKQDCAFREV